MSVSSPPILKILSDLDIDLMDVDNDMDYLRALMEATNALVITNASDKRIPVLQEEIARVRADRKAADPKFKQRVKKTTVSPQKIMGQKMLPPANVKKLDLKKLSPQGGSGGGGVGGGVGGSDILSQILASVTSIRDILVNQIKQKRDDAKKKSRATETANRKEKESGLEVLKKGFKGIKKGAEKVIAPVKSLFKQVLEFIGKIVLGRVLFKLFDWFSDEKNQDKVKAIGKFLKKTWPVLLAAYLLFGNAFGRMTVKLGVMITRFTFRLMRKIIPALVKAIAKMKVGKWLKRIPGLSAGGLLPKLSEGGRGGPSASEGIIQGPQSGFPVSLDGGKSTAFEGHGTEEVRKKGNDSFVIPIDTPDTRKNPFLTEQRTDEANKLGFPPSGGGGQAKKSPMDTLVNMGMNQMKKFWGITNTKGGTSVPDGAGGFRIQSQEELDAENNAKLPLGLTMTEDGQNIDMGKFAGDKARMIGELATDPKFADALRERGKEFGFDNMTAEQFQGMANKEADNLQFSINQFIPGTESHFLAGESASINKSTSARKMMSNGGLLRGTYTQEQANAMAESFDNRPMAQMSELREERKEILRRQVNGKWASKEDKKRYREVNAQIKEIKNKIKAIATPKSTSTSTPTQTPVTEKKKSGGLFGGLFGGGKKEGGRSSGILGPIGNVDDMVNKDKYKAPPKTDAVKKEGGGGSSGILGPISSDYSKMVNKDKYKVNPPVKKSVVQAYEEEKSKIVALGGGGNTASKSRGGNDLPNINAAAKRSVYKIKTLGISV